MVATRSENPLPPPTPSSSTIPLAGSSTSAPSVPSSTTTGGPPPSAPTQVVPSLDVILQHAKSTIMSDSMQLGNLRRLLEEVASSDAGDVILGGMLADQTGRPVDPLVAVLHAKSDTLAYIYILTARLNAPFKGAHPDYLNALLQACVFACSHLDPRQIQGTKPQRINRFSHRLLALAKFLGSPGSAVDPLLLLLRVWSHGNYTNFTAIHQDFVEACVLCGDFEFAQRVARVPLEGIFSGYYGLHYLDFLRYHYLAGMAFAATKNWKEAEGAFESVVSAPASAASWVQVAAYKKLVLVQLIKDGKTTSLPKYVSATVSRAIKQHAATYKSLAESFESKGARAISSADRDIFAKDKNNGLILQLLDTALSRQIVRLTKTYEVLLVPEMAKLLGLDGADSAQVQQDLVEELFRMVASKMINAKISYHTPASAASSSTTPPAFVPMVTFLPPAERYVGPEIIERLRVLNEDAALVNEQVWTEDRRVGMTVKYLQKAAKEESAWGGGAGGAGAGAMDEDLMESIGGGGSQALGSRKTYDDNF